MSGSTARAAVLIVRNGAVAMIERRTSQRGRYYTFPGGGVEPGESPAEAAAREAWEELGLRVAIGPCVAEVMRDGVMQYHFAAEIVGGMFGTGTGAEIVGRTAPERGTYLPVWLPLDELTTRPVFPTRVAALVADAAARQAWLATQAFEDNG